MSSLAEGNGLSRMRRRTVVCAPLLPVLAWIAAIWIVGGLSASAAPVSRLLQTASADALLLTAALAVAAAPLFGVAVVSSRPVAAAVGHVFGTLLVGVAAFVTTSAIITFVAHGNATEYVAVSHATLAAGTLSLVALGGLVATLCREPLDAAAISLLSAVILSAGVLVGGEIVGDAPKRVVELSLLASPFVSAVAAAQIDLVRMEPLYQMSPLAHLGVEYPPWYAACAWHTGIAAVCFAALTWRSRTWSTTATF